MQAVCGVACAITVAVAKKEKEQRKEAQAERRADKAKRERLKTRSEWMKEAQAAVNRYCRLRDIKAGRGCITCGAPFRGTFGGAFDAGHMISRGSAPQLKFRTDNIALQCVKDNRYLGGLALDFRRAMIERIGLEKVEALESMQGPAKFTVEYLQRIKRIFTKKAHRLGVVVT